MSSTNTERLKDDMHVIAEDIEQLLHDASESAGERADEFSHRLRRVRDRIVRIEHDANGRVHEAAGQSRRYVREHPWTTVAAAAGIAFLAGLLSRGIPRD